VAFVLGVLAVVFYNPLAASARTQAEELFAEAFGKESNFLKTKNAGSWLRQDGADGSSVMNAGGVADGGLRLLTLTVFQFDKEGRFVERVEAERATLREGYWELEKALVAGAGREPERYERYLISTYLTPERVRDAPGSIISLSFWSCPASSRWPSARVVGCALPYPVRIAPVTASALDLHGPFCGHCVVEVIPVGRRSDYGRCLG